MPVNTRVLRLSLATCTSMLLLQGCQLVPASPLEVQASTGSPPPMEWLLSCHERLRELSAEALTAEAQAGQRAGSSSEKLCHALLLSIRRLPGDNTRVEDLLTDLARQTDVAQADWTRLASLLATVHAAARHDLKRLEDRLERQGHQLRESQKKTEQLLERLDDMSQKLEALKAIELSLPVPATRPPAMGTTP